MWTENQTRAIETLDRDVCVAAGAGSGKTGVLVARFVRVVMGSRSSDLPERQRAGVGNMLVITFTEKATREMKARLVAEFTRLGLTDERRALETAYISTIHGFCSRVLQENPFEAGVDPGFTPLDPTEAARLRAAAYERAVEAAFARQDTPIVDLVGSAQNARMFGGGDPLAALFTATSRATDRLRSAGLRLDDARGHQRTGPDAIDSLSLSPTIWLLNQVAAALRGLLDRIRAAGDALAAGAASFVREVGTGDPLAVDLPGDAPPSAVLERAGALAGVLRGARQSVAALRRSTGASPEAVPLMALMDALVRLIKPYDKVDAELEMRALEVIRGFWALLLAAWDEYDRAKRDQGVLDPDDLQSEAVHLLSTAPGVLLRYRRRFRHLMIDEFQDTSPVQMHLVKLLHGKDPGGSVPNALFIVGDAQQSIYGFREAEPAIFRNIARRFRHTRSDQYEYVALADNFRSRPEILTAVNHLFGQVWHGTDQPFIPLEAGAAFEPKEGPSVEAIVGQYVGPRATRELEARALAQRIREIVEGREVVITRRGDPRCGQPVRYGDVAVLFRVFSDVNLYEAALAEAGIPTFVVGGGRKYYARSEVRDIRNLLIVLDTPLQDVALAAVLRSPMVGVDMDTLVRLSSAAREGAATTGGRLFPAIPLLLADASLPDDQRRMLERIHSLVGDLRADAKGGVGRLLERAVVETKYDARVLVRPNGKRRLANVRKLLAMAHASEDGDIARFVQRLRDIERVSDQEGDAPTEEEASDVVRLITVHKAKGLEFPAVFVADMGRSRYKSGRDVFAVDGRASSIACKVGDYQTLAFRAMVARSEEAETAESARVLYVALTRAREHLVLCGCSTARAANTSWAGMAFPLAGITLPDVPETRVGPAGVAIRIIPYGR